MVFSLFFNWIDDFIEISQQTSTFQIKSYNFSSSPYYIISLFPVTNSVSILQCRIYSVTLINQFTSISTYFFIQSFSITCFLITTFVNECFKKNYDFTIIFGFYLNQIYPIILFFNITYFKKYFFLFFLYFVVSQYINITYLILLGAGILFILINFLTNQYKENKILFLEDFLTISFSILLSLITNIR